MPNHSVTEWLSAVKRGEDQGAQRLWERYFPDLVLLAAKRLAGVPRRMEDEEDVALSALKSFCLAANGNQFPDLNDREELWQLLCRITHHKVIDHIRRTQKQFGEARIQNLEQLGPTPSKTMEVLLEAPEPAADVAALMADEVRALLQRLPDDEHRRIAVQKMHGATNKELARELDSAVRTIERRLVRIRQIWQEDSLSST